MRDMCDVTSKDAFDGVVFVHASRRMLYTCEHVREPIMSLPVGALVLHSKGMTSINTTLSALHAGIARGEFIMSSKVVGCGDVC